MNEWMFNDTPAWRLHWLLGVRQSYNYMSERLINKISHINNYMLPCILELFLVLVGLHNWCNNSCGMYYPVCGMMHIKHPWLLMWQSGFLSCYPSSLTPLSLTPNNHILYKNVLMVLLIKTFPSFFPSFLPCILVLHLLFTPADTKSRTVSFSD